MKSISNEILKPIYLAEMSFDDGDFQLHQSLLLEEFSFKSPFGSFDNIPSYMHWLKSFNELVNQQGGTRHLVMNSVINFLDDDNVIVKSYLVIINKKSMAVMGTSVIEDTLKLTDQGWKFSFREISSDQSSKE